MTVDLRGISPERALPAAKGWSIHRLRARSSHARNWSANTLQRVLHERERTVAEVGNSSGLGYISVNKRAHKILSFFFSPSGRSDVPLARGGRDSRAWLRERACVSSVRTYHVNDTITDGDGGCTVNVVNANRPITPSDCRQAGRRSVSRASTHQWFRWVSERGTLRAMTRGWRGGARRRPGNDDCTRVGFVVSWRWSSATRLPLLVMLSLLANVSAVCPITSGHGKGVARERFSRVCRSSFDCSWF